MNPRVRWVRVELLGREERGGELRWIVNRETTVHEATGVEQTRAVIRHPGAAVVVPVLDDGRVLLMRQYRYSLDDELWELPAGTLAAREHGPKVGPDESPERGALRELEEETGWRAGRLDHLASCYAMPGISDEQLHLFVARDLTPGAVARDEGELIAEVTPFTGAELTAMIARGDIRDAKTLAALFYYLAARPGGVSLAIDSPPPSSE